jgi:hypothetical protein
MRVRSFILGVLLLGVVATTGCGWRRANYRHPCYTPAPAPVLLPATAVPVTAGCCPCGCP